MASLNMSWERRRAIYKASVNRPELGIANGDEVKCRVFGIFQVADGEDVNPYFIVELEDGRCTYVAPEELQFIREADEAFW